jgi:hypothetical protein
VIFDLGALPAAGAVGTLVYVNADDEPGIMLEGLEVVWGEDRQVRKPIRK